MSSHTLVAMFTQGQMATLRENLFKTWILTPLGCAALLYFVVAIDSIIGLGTVAFPASVTCLLCLFLALLASEAVLPKHIMHAVLKIL